MSASSMVSAPFPFVHGQGEFRVNVPLELSEEGCPGLSGDLPAVVGGV